MLKFFKGLFSTTDIVDSGLKMMDSAFFTDQERANFLLEWNKATAPQAKSRRFIAVSITLLWCLGVLLCGLLLYLDSPKFEQMAGFMEDTVNQPFSIILAFYFMSQVIQRSKS